MVVVCLLLLLLLLLLEVSAKPNIVHILADDLGWGEVGFHNTIARSLGDIKTPNIDKLAETGLELDRFYTEKICSPTRSSLLSGRHGIHVNTQNVVPQVVNEEDALGGYQGVPLNMTLFPEKLKIAGYTTRIVGKWDVGMASDRHSPAERGFDSWLGYWHHSNDYWSHEEEKCDKNNVKDLWVFDKEKGINGPAINLANGDNCSFKNQDGEKCEYEETLFANEVQSILKNHATATAYEDKPLFLFYSMHLVHMPLEPLQAALEEFAHIDDELRQKMHAMVWIMDNIVGGIIDTLHETGLWNNTLVVFHSDNGGEIMFGGTCGGNNYPLRGGKFSNFEGGIRATAVVSGGALPKERRGRKTSALISVADFYSTCGHIAGLTDVELYDENASVAGLPSIDSKNCWNVFRGEAEECRSEIPIGDTSALGFNQDGQALVGSLISGEYKLIVGPKNKGYEVGQNVITGPLFPNRSHILLPDLEYAKICNRDPSSGCLFNIFDDPSEYNNLANSQPDIFIQLLARIDELQEGVYSPKRGYRSPAACETAKENGYYWGPFLKSV